MSQDLDGFTLYLVGHAHIDLGYRWRWNETVHRVARDTFGGVLDMMDRVPEFTFVQSQLALYRAIQEHYPHLFARILERIAEGRWIVVGGWCEYDHTMPSGESMIRQHLLGARYARQELGCEVTMAWAPDAFSGHAHTLPTILKGCGIERLLYGRGVPNDTPYFWWEGPDGSRVLAYSPAYGYNGSIGGRMLETAARWRERTGDAEMMYLYGRGDHGGGPRAGDFEALEVLRQEPDAPQCVHTTPRAFFDGVLAEKQDVAVYAGEMIGFCGSFSSEGRAKQRNRALEHLLLTAERFATLAMFLQRKPCYPRVDFEQAWRAVLHHQFHDELPGTSRAAVYRDNDADYDRTETLVQGILDDALDEIAARLDTRGRGTPVIVYNPLAWTRSESVRMTLRLSEPVERLVVRDVEGRAVPTEIFAVRREGHFWYADVLFFARGVPPLGYAVYRAWPEDRRGVQPAKGVEVDEARDVIILQSSDLLVTIDKHTGHVVSVFDKRVNRETLAGAGNVLEAIDEIPGRSTAWIAALSDQVQRLETPDDVEIVENGPVQGVVRASYRYRDSYFCQEVILIDGVPRVEFRLRAEWYERDCCLKVAFPIEIEGAQARFEAPLGAIERAADGSEVPALRWIDLSNRGYGVSLLNDGRYAFDVDDTRMRMTVVRGIPDLDPMADVGEHTLRYALYPHANDWHRGDTVRQGWEFNMPLLARQALRRAGVIAPWIASGVNDAMPPSFGFVEVAPYHVVLVALKLEEEDWGPGSPLIVRLYETVGQETEARLTFAVPLMMCEETNHLEERIESDSYRWEGNEVSITIRPHEIKTFRLALAVPALGISEGETPPAELAFEGG